MASFCEMDTAKIALLFCISSVANIAVFLVPLCCMQAERSVDARNWAKLRAQTPKPFQEYGTVPRIRNCVLDYWRMRWIFRCANDAKWLPRSVQHPFCLRLQCGSQFSSSSCNKWKQIEVLSQETGRIEGTWPKIRNGSENTECRPDYGKHLTPLYGIRHKMLFIYARTYIQIRAWACPCVRVRGRS